MTGVNTVASHPGARNLISPRPCGSGITRSGRGAMGETLCAKCGLPILLGTPMRWSIKTDVEHVEVSGWCSLTAGRYAVATRRDPETYHYYCLTPDA